MNGKSDEEILSVRKNAIKMVEDKIGEKVEVLESFFEDFKIVEGSNVSLSYLSKSLELLAQADIAYFVDGWKNARGCKIEYQCAIQYGIDEIFAENDDTRDYRNIPDSEFAIYAGTKMVGAIPGVNSDGVDGYIVRYEDGYTSWSPKDVFEKAYRKTECLNFGIALELCKKGAKISRNGWNGKGLFVVYQKAYPEGIPCNKNTADSWGIPEGSLFKCNPYLQINTVDGSHSMWVPSINDCLADDWDVVE